LLGVCRYRFPGAARLNRRPLEIRYFKFLLHQLKIFGAEILAHNLDEMKYKEKKMHP